MYLCRCVLSFLFLINEYEYTALPPALAGVEEMTALQLSLLLNEGPSEPCYATVSSQSLGCDCMIRKLKTNTRE